MQNTSKITDLKKLLPFGAKKQIQQRAKVSPTTITAFFEGRVSRTSVRNKILIATKEYLKERKDSENEIISQILRQF